MLLQAPALRRSPFPPRKKKKCRSKKKKAVRFGPLERGKGGREVSGKAMQGEVKANAKTLGLEKTTTLEEGCTHLKFATSFGCLLPEQPSSQILWRPAVETSMDM